MDPITAIAAATTAFNAIKKGGKISDGTNFVARQYGGKIGK